MALNKTIYPTYVLNDSGEAVIENVPTEQPDACVVDILGDGLAVEGQEEQLDITRQWKVVGRQGDGSPIWGPIPCDLDRIKYNNSSVYVGRP